MSPRNWFFASVLMVVMIAAVVVLLPRGSDPAGSGQSGAPGRTGSQEGAAEEGSLTAPQHSLEGGKPAASGPSRMRP